MASLTTRANGGRFIGFVDQDGKPQTISLGRCPQRHAETVRLRVDDLAGALLRGEAPRDATSRWVAERPDKFHAKLARVGLVTPRASMTLGGWLATYLEQRKGELKPHSVRKLEQTKAKLLARFPADTPLRSITPAQAAEWRAELKAAGRRAKTKAPEGSEPATKTKAAGLSEATIKTLCGNAKTIMHEAVRRKLITENPFRHLRSGATASEYRRYIAPEDAQKVIDALAGAEWKLLFGLARWAGLRIPSESHGLTWADVDWERGRLTVRSPKTERHAGHESRVVPITPRLMKLLQNRYDEVPEREPRIITLVCAGWWQVVMRRACDAAGVEQWQRCWQTLRSSCEVEWAATFPQYAVSRWIGHSITVSGKHYANAVPDELFARAAGAAETDAEKAQRKMHETAGNDRKEQPGAHGAGDANSETCKDLQESSSSCGSGEERAAGDSNPQPSAP